MRASPLGSVLGLLVIVAAACKTTTPPADCRTTGCEKLGATCVSQACGAAWACKECATAVVQEPEPFCGCDGKTIRTTTIGC